MQNAESHDVVTLENQITERYGLLISQTQLAELLGRTTGGLRYSLSYVPLVLTPHYPVSVGSIHIHSARPDVY